MDTEMTEELYTDEVKAYQLAEDRSSVTIVGYVGDVQLFKQWCYKKHR
jgi:hypothetical protein